VVIARGDDPWEVLFLKRHHKSGFMANAYVFPGGRVDEADASPSLVSRIDGLDPGELCQAMEGVASEQEAASYVIAAVRETFEEAGVLLARDRTGELVQFTDEASAERFDAWRDRLNAGEASFESFLTSEGLRVAGEGLRYFDHWVTPIHEPRRFDARFFVVAAPPGQRVAHDGRETTESVWRTPDDALEAHEAGTFMLPPPTWRVLMDLRRWSRRSEMLSAVRPLDGVVRTEPHMMTVDGVFALALPGDPEHGGSVARPHGAQRILLDQGHWSEG
jgi:8-oxo-dGTP pyrophosphatase MutT (NUDIX family)